MNVLHIFKKGCHVASAGERLCFSDADLERVADAYDPTLHRAPLVLGHPKTDDPAYGWVTRLMVSGGNLLAFVEQVSADLKEWVRTGRYGAISSSFYGTEDPHNPRPGGLYLRHVGFLGAAAPGVKGMVRPSFAEGCAYSEIAIDNTGWCEFYVPPGYTVDPQGLDLHMRSQDVLRRHPGMTFRQAVELAEVRAGAETQFLESPAIRVEFSELDTYLAFCEAEALGRVSIF
jgi:hypothetical protein